MLSGREAVERLILAEPRGFCAGVEMAIKSLSWMVRVFEPPVYCYHEIVHNAVVVEAFEALELLDDDAVVHDLVVAVHGRVEDAHHPGEGLYGHLDARTESARLRQAYALHLHRRNASASTL